MDLLRPFLSRIAASLVAAFAAWLSTTTGITLDADTTAGLIAVMLGTFGIIYSFIHKLVDKWINPGDAAAESIVKAEKRQADSPLLRS